MKATRWYGKHDIRVENVPDPVIQDARDAIIRVTSTAICGSDLHIYDGYIPTMEKGDILGHEFMGVIEIITSAGASGAVSSSSDDDPMCRHTTVWVSSHAFQNGSQ